MSTPEQPREVDESTDHGYELLPDAYDGGNAPGDGDWGDGR